MYQGLSKVFLWARDLTVRKWVTSEEVIFQIPLDSLTTKNLIFKEVKTYPRIQMVEVIFYHTENGNPLVKKDTPRVPPEEI